MYKRILRDNQAVQEVISKLTPFQPGRHKKTYAVEIKEHKEKRSIAQNSLYWVWMKEVSKQMHEAGYALKPDTTWHLYFRQEFLGIKPVEVMGKIIEELISTTELNTKEFTEYLEKIELYVGSEWHLTMPHPNDLYFESMGIKR